MKGTIGIIAPMIDEQQFHVNFNLKLKQNQRELSLAAFNEWAGKEFITERVSRGIDHDKNIPAAGYYLESLLHQHGYNTLLTNKYDPGTLQKIAGKDPLAVCVSTSMIIATDSLLTLFSSIRQTMPDTLIIAGGVLIWKNFLLYRNHLHEPLHYPLLPWMLFHPDHAVMNADIMIVSPHGKFPLLQVLSSLEKGRNTTFDDIPNLCLPGNNGFFFTQRKDEQVNYDEDYTRWDLISEIPDKIPFRTSIGCPYRCRFCDFCHLFPRIYFRSPKSLSQELSLMKRSLGQKAAIIHVSDDNVFINKQRLQEVCHAMIDSGLKKWIGFMRAEAFTDDDLDLMERSGLMMGIIGIESGDQGQLERMKKHQKIENIKKGVEQLDARGIGTLMTFVIGFPGENAHTLKNTAGFLNQLSLKNLLASYQMYPLLIQPLCELSWPQTRKKWKIEGSMGNWSHYTMNSEEASKACYELFREVSNVPYHYFEESNFFNRAKFTFSERKTLFQLRQQLTIQLIENSPWEQINTVLIEMTRQMKFPIEAIREDLLLDISI